MGRAAGDEAAGGQESRPEYTSDRTTLARVAEALRGQLDGQVLPAAGALIGPAEPLERRTCTLLAPVYAKGYR
jgi:hypothetical protein